MNAPKWIAAAGLACLLTAGSLVADDCIVIKDYRWAHCCQAEDNDDCCQPQPEEVRFFGPCPCEPRKTLFQWSYRTSFGGGPPGLDEPLVGDRPDFTEASTTVGRGVAQLEMGYTYLCDRSGDDFIRTHSYPETLLRVGVLADWLELRIAYNYLQTRVREGGVVGDFSGSEDLYLGLKLGLTPQEGWLPEIALAPQMTVPSGASPFSAGEVLPSLNLLLGWEIMDGLDVTTNTVFSKAVEDTGDNYIEFAQSVAIGIGITDRIGSYVEWFALIPSGAIAVRPEHYFDGGFTYSVTNDWQLDIRAGVGLNEHAADFFAGAGMIYRFH